VASEYNLRVSKNQSPRRLDYGYTEKLNTNMDQIYHADSVYQIKHGQAHYRQKASDRKSKTGENWYPANANSNNSEWKNSTLKDINITTNKQQEVSSQRKHYDDSYKKNLIHATDTEIENGEEKTHYQYSSGVNHNDMNSIATGDKVMGNKASDRWTRTLMGGNKVFGLRTAKGQIVYSTSPSPSPSLTNENIQKENYNNHNLPNKPNPHNPRSPFPQKKSRNPLNHVATSQILTKKLLNRKPELQKSSELNNCYHIHSPHPHHTPQHTHQVPTKTRKEKDHGRYLKNSLNINNK
jgi:hypothetical protein